MSAIIQSKCDNPDCNFKISNEYHFPIWKSDTPKESRKIPVGIRNERFVVGYINRFYCLSCNALQPDLKGSEMCLNCNTDGNYVKDEDLCPKCNKGVIKEVEDKTIRF